LTEIGQAELDGPRPGADRLSQALSDTLEQHSNLSRALEATDTTLRAAQQSLQSTTLTHSTTTAQREFEQRQRDELTQATLRPQQLALSEAHRSFSELALTLADTTWGPAVPHHITQALHAAHAAHRRTSLGSALDPNAEPNAEALRKSLLDLNGLHDRLKSVLLDVSVLSSQAAHEVILAEDRASKLYVSMERSKGLHGDELSPCLAWQIGGGLSSALCLASAALSCPMCGQAMTPDHLSQHVQRLAEERGALLQAVDSLKVSAQTLAGLHSSLSRAAALAGAMVTALCYAPLFVPLVVFPSRDGLVQVDAVRGMEGTLSRLRSIDAKLHTIAARLKQYSDTMDAEHLRIQGIAAKKREMSDALKSLEQELMAQQVALHKHDILEKKLALDAERRLRLSQEIATLQGSVDFATDAVEQCEQHVVGLTHKLASLRETVDL
jgi:hypothetical protein